MFANSSLLSVKMNLKQMPTASTAWVLYIFYQAKIQITRKVHRGTTHQRCHSVMPTHAGLSDARSHIVNTGTWKLGDPKLTCDKKTIPLFCSFSSTKDLNFHILLYLEIRLVEELRRGWHPFTKSRLLEGDILLCDIYLVFLYYHIWCNNTFSWFNI